MTETIAVIFIFFVLIFFGLVFYYSYSQFDLKEKTEEFVTKRAIDTTTRVLFLPELQCTRGEAGPETYCLDLMKLRSLEAMIKRNRDYYFDLFSYANITVQQVYPTLEKWVIYDFPKNDFTRKEPTYFTVALRDGVAGASGNPAYNYGYVTVEVYS